MTTRQDLQGASHSTTTMPARFETRTTDAGAGPRRRWPFRHSAILLVALACTACSRARLTVPDQDDLAQSGIRDDAGTRDDAGRVSTTAASAPEPAMDDDSEPATDAQTPQPSNPPMDDSSAGAVADAGTRNTGSGSIAASAPQTSNSGGAAGAAAITMMMMTPQPAAGGRAAQRPSAVGQGTMQPSAAGNPAASSNAGAASASGTSSAAGSVDACRARFNACLLGGDAAGCIREAHDCGLFPDGVDAGIACFTQWTLCIVARTFDFATCARRAVPCGLLEEHALVCADELDACVLRRPGEIQQCWQEGAACGVFPGDLLPATM